MVLKCSNKKMMTCHQTQEFPKAFNLIIHKYIQPSLQLLLNQTCIWFLKKRIQSLSLIGYYMWIMIHIHTLLQNRNPIEKKMQSINGGNSPQIESESTHFQKCFLQETAFSSKPPYSSASSVENSPSGSPSTSASTVCRTYLAGNPGYDAEARSSTFFV